MVKRGDGGLPEYRQDPEKFEAGTQNIAGVLGLGAAVEYLRSRDFAGLTEREADLARAFEADWEIYAASASREPMPVRR